MLLAVVAATVVNIEAARRSVDANSAHVARLRIEVCTFKHARDLAVLGDSLLTGRMPYSDFASIWRTTRQEYWKGCGDSLA